MIKSFKHKGLESFFKTGNTKGVNQDHVKKLRNLLAKLDSATEIDDMMYPGSKLHPLKGKLIGNHAVAVSGNWRVTFKFKNGNAEVIDYLDYH
ncbi:type II toxin-antitoxin system RelE/ParE family toxin [Glaciecola sp. MF2-115]|uniref:type II toxin-antitoxin system RelE/ParE family toxin n=1 Tax=Glaciecola sp. MF2-115 TaxID=3384827 RepID=UPI00399FA792